MITGGPGLKGKLELLSHKAWGEGEGFLPTSVGANPGSFWN